MEKLIDFYLLWTYGPYIYESSSKLRHIASVIVSVQRYNKPIISVHIPTISVGAYKKSNPIMKDEADDIH